MKTKIYIAGPISGLTYKEASSYFEEETKILEDIGFKVFTPMIKHEYDNTFSEDEELQPFGSSDNPIASNHAIFKRDVWMVDQVDIVLVNFTIGKKDRVSIGSVMELMAGHIQGKHTIVVMDDDDVHQHVFVIEAADVVVNKMYEAHTYLRSFL